MGEVLGWGIKGRWSEVGTEVVREVGVGVGVGRLEAIGGPSSDKCILSIV